ncbi:MAG: ABC transporter ATP-binding protein [Bacteroidetes bacterium]|nr:ABC transporter ATP-binding protein [Bacteroidota bacterium]MCA6441986.1 ABC transporter ATP-binding protein [Bacteroidota bacterium]
MRNLKPLNAYFLKYKWHFGAGVLFVALSTIFGTYQGVIVRDGTNKILELISLKQEIPGMYFLMLAIQLIGFALISGLFMFLMRQTIIVMSRHIEFDQKNEIYRHYQSLHTSFFKQNTTGDLMNRISEDVGKVRMYTGPAIMYIANTIVTTLTVLVFMFSVNTKLTLLVFLPLPILSFIIYKVSDKINKQSGLVQKELSNLTTKAQESFSAIRVIKAYGREDFFEKEMQAKGIEYKRTALKLNAIESLFHPVMILMIGLSVLVTVWIGGKLAINKQIEAGNITEFILYVYKLTWPFASLGWVTSLIQRASASQKRINEFLKVETFIKNINQKVYDIQGNIEFKNVSFIYPENNIKALNNVSFSLKAGEMLGITGPVGCGKTTLLNLITRKYDSTSGEIIIDGVSIQNHNLNLLRKNLAVVPQDVFLFSDTVYNNIAFGVESTSKDEVEAYAKKAAVHSNILEFKDAYETVVGERGVTLSGGQKQRISIARALIVKPKLLMFDDCLSAVDTETEEEIIKELKSEMRGKTSIIVSHRLSSIQHANHIIYLQDGAILEQGTHAELMALNKSYAKLYQLQNN